MSSVVSGFEYDIFLSYRHNDNKSGWVTEFVNALQEELGSTIKEPLSIYFDKNPHDGLLETHNVDKSLEGKLKCLIFIPILSQTYCDPKSFAWQHEFCAFNKLAKADSFGRDIKLTNGNVASRILPVKIHDLDAEDKATIESEIGGIHRAIEFIYTSPGVNRPLRANEDRPNDNLNKTLYRDQINKTANAIKEICMATKNPSPQKAGHVHQHQPVSSSSKRKYVLAGVASLALFAGLYFLYPKAFFSQASAPLDKSIAVLPFMNMSNDPEQEYFSDGLSEEIINALAQIEGLKVIARTSSFQFKGKNEDLRVIGTNLGVATVLEGSVRKSGGTVRITAQLIKTSDGTHLWSRIYDRKLADILQVQDEIAAAIANDFQLTISPEIHRQRSSTNEEAYRLYQIGRSFYDRADISDTRLSVHYFEEAVKLDSTFASAWSYLSIASSHIDSAKTFQYNQTALRLDPYEPDALANKIYYTTNALKFREANEVLQRSMPLKLEVPRLMRQQAQCLARLGRYEEAIAYCRRALTLDPLQAYSHSILGLALAADGKFAEAETHFRRLFEINKAANDLITIQLLQGKLAEFNSLIEFVTNPAEKELLFASKYFLEGQKDKASQYLAMVKTRGEWYSVAQQLAFRGEYDEAFQYLAKAVAERDDALVSLKATPFFIPMRGDRRFKAITEKLGYPD